MPVTPQDLHPRIRRLLDRRPIAIGAAALPLLAGAVSALINAAGRGAAIPEDLAVFREGARDALHGLPLYGAHFGSTLAVALPFLYPPAAALFLTPLQTMPPTVMKWVWELLCVCEVLLVVAYSFRGLRDRSGPA